MAVVADQALVVDIDDDDTKAGAAYEPSPVKKPKVTVQRTKAASRRAKGSEDPQAAAVAKPAFRRPNYGRCYATCFPGWGASGMDSKRNDMLIRRGRRWQRDAMHTSQVPVAVTMTQATALAKCAAVEATATANGGHLRCARSSEEAVATSDVLPCEEGVTVPSKSKSTASCGEVSAVSSMHELGAELTDEEFAKFDCVGKVRTAVKRSRCAYKMRRAAQRAASAVGDEVDREVEVLENEQRVRRQQQCDATRCELNRRRKEHYGQERRASDGAQVNLVQRGRVETASGVCNVVGASDGLPTATMLVGGKRQAVNFDSGAGHRPDAERGRVNIKSLVDFIEGIGGFLLDVVGVWRFSRKNVFGQWVTLDACIIDGCSHEFLIGVNFVEHRQANIDFKKNEFRYDVQGERVIIPFRTTYMHDGVTKAAVRLVNAAKLRRRAVQPVDITVGAPDGEVGVFLPTGDFGSVLTVAAVTTAHDGKALVPVINTHGGREQAEIGCLAPVDADITMIKMHDEMINERLHEWMKELDEDETPLDDEEDVNVGTTDPKVRVLVLKWLRAYRKLMRSDSNCPPASSLRVEH
ncbi:hypothetical protein PHMEG_00013300 [Phytophthora megakarya]|uniref:Uncharacterized protein n=1 Tax=Phytophthora megakarya TaxID=4795 RepID=A0A225W846_9STRA|nr:hypothetical protein PHMEG_00013300 [Phytophthora megakarya]